MSGDTSKAPFYSAGSYESGRELLDAAIVGDANFQATSTHNRGFLLGAMAIALLLPSCVNLTPPWQSGTGGTTVAGTGGGGSGGSRVDSSAAGGNEGDAPLPDQPDSEDDVNQQATDAPADSSGVNADTRLDGRDSSALDVGSDRPVLGGAGGSVSQGGAVSGGGAVGRGGSGGGSTGTGGGGSGGQIGTGGIGGSGAGGATAIDAGSVCVGRPGSDAGTGIGAGLVAYYSCDQTSGPTLTDQSGNNNNGTLVTGTGGTAGYSFGTGKVGTGALDLVAAGNGYATLPSGLLANTCDVTVASWVFIKTSQNWQRVFDFGKDTNVYMFLAATNNLTKVVRFAITVGGNAAAEQRVDGQAELAVGQWSHVAIVLGASGATLYVNGSPVGTNANVVLRPADLGTPLYYYIGRSQFADPYLDGNIDDFRIYERALSASEILALSKM
jgi:hypothetical protein